MKTNETFTVGQKVICIDKERCVTILELNKIYTVKECYPGRETLKLVEIEGFFYKYRFIDAAKYLHNKEFQL